MLVLSVCFSCTRKLHQPSSETTTWNRYCEDSGNSWPPHWTARSLWLSVCFATENYFRNCWQQRERERERESSVLAVYLLRSLLPPPFFFHSHLYTQDFSLNAVCVLRMFWTHDLIRSQLLHVHVLKTSCARGVFKIKTCGLHACWFC